MFDSYQDIFNQRGVAYHQAMLRYPEARRHEFALVLDAARLCPGDVVVDMPSGGGYLRDWIGTEGVEVVAIETTQAFYDQCPERPGLQRRLSPLDQTGLPDASADVVISLAGLHHVDDKAGVFAEVHRILQPGGRFVAADVRAGSRVEGFLDTFVDAHNSMGHTGTFVDDGFRAALAGAGFEVARDETAAYPWVFGSADEMVDCCTLMFGLDRATPDHVRSGIAEWLGSTEADGCEMNWELQILVASRPAG
ncbi:class I SAM-dependent methyltransferase [Rubrivirga sp.]|uniref:class I SAM-dependent methyltransferase n=1 Tax=Rubrivirga sp. TaxID=1885344 RepID=UPI003B52DD48